MACSLFRNPLGLTLPRSSCMQGFGNVCSPAVIILLNAGSKGLHRFSQKGITASSSFFPQPVPELWASFKGVSDTQALQKLTGASFDLFLWGFPTSVRAEPGSTQRHHQGCWLDASLTAELFVS